MQANRMIKVASDFVSDYDTFGVQEILNSAIQLVSSGRDNSTHYLQVARQIKNKAELVISGSSFNLYPDDLMQVFKQSAYATAMPTRVAKQVINGLPDDPSQAMSSTEFQYILKLASSARRELQSIVSAAKKFHIEPVTIPDDLFSLDVLLPRNTIDNDTAKLVSYLNKYLRTATDFTELVSNERKAPPLVYASTSDPVIAFAMAFSAAAGFLKLYGMVLDQAIKTVSLLQSLKTFREIKPTPPEVNALEDRIRKSISIELQNIVEKVVQSMKVQTSNERTNELKASITTNLPGLLEATTNGARLNITVESFDRIEKLQNGVAQEDGTQEGTTDSLMHEIRERILLGTKLDEGVRSLGDNAIRLLQASNVPSEEDTSSR